MFDNQAFDRVRNVVSADDFFAGEHYHLWSAISERLNEGKAVDGTILRDVVNGNELFQYVGGVEYLAKLMEYAVYGPEVDDYALIIADTARRRQYDRCNQQFP